VDLAYDPERRIKFQYELQKYVDHAISSTLNLPAWGSDLNNEDKIKSFAKIISDYASGLRGLTVYPDSARGGQPITSVPYDEANAKRGVIYEDNSEEQCLSGVCGI
jgi:ribonucleoside-diphosphate reductase alpha chain